MRPHRRITIWENRNRTRVLRELRILLIAYFVDPRYALHLDGLSEKDLNLEDIRSRINLMIPRARNMTIAAGIGSSMTWYPPPAVGGFVSQVDVFLDVFQLDPIYVSPRDAIDIVERAIGVYEHDKLNAAIRTFNPLFWLNLLLTEIASVPFIMLTRLGFSQSRVERSLGGKLAKGLLQLVVYVAAFLTTLHFLGWLDSFKKWIGIR